MSSSTPCSSTSPATCSRWPILGGVRAFPDLLAADLHRIRRRGRKLIPQVVLIIASAARHDARYLEPICPTAMLFIPCHERSTHNPAEAIEPTDATAATRVLAAFLARVVTGG